jgi:hypothetical protein
MSYIPTNYSTNINGALVDLGQLNNNTASVNIVPTETYTNNGRITSFPEKTVINQSAISMSINTSGSISGNQTYTFGPQKRGMWVAAGQTGIDNVVKFAYSYDGINWTASSSNGGFTDYGVITAWDGTMWVAAGKVRDGSIHLAYSYDGINWTQASSNGGLTEGYYVATNGLMWVAGGTGGQKIAYSYDGINWTQASSNGGLAQECRSIVWNGTMWVAGGQATSITGAIAYSYDGINWTAASLNGGLAYACRCVAWNGTMWLAGGQAGQTNSETGAIAYSYDGINWNAFISTGGLSHTYWGFAWNGTMWLACGESSKDICAIAYSYDGIYWEPTYSNGGLAARCRNIAWNGTMWVAVGQATTATGAIAYSYDGVEWMPASSNGGLGSHVIGVTWNAALPHTITIPRPMYVAGLNNGKIIYSYDGKTWNNAIMPSLIANTIQIKSVKYNGKLWVAVGGNAYAGSVNITVILYSYDGINWKSDTINPIATTHSMIDSVDYNETMWVATVYGAALILYSYNGIVWNSMTNVTGDSAGCIKWNGTMWVAAGRSYNNESSTVAYSYNGVDWFAAPLNKNLATNPNVRGFSCIEWNGSMWIGGGLPDSTYIWGSYDGINWSVRTKGTGQTGAPKSVSWDGNRWIMCCGNKTDTSVDGFTWTTNNTSDVGNIIKFTGSFWIIGGMANTIRYSSNGVDWITRTITGTVLSIETNISKPYNLSITPTVIGCGGGYTEITENGGKWRNIYDANFTKIVSNSTGLFYVATGSSTAINKLSYSYDLYTWTGLGSSIFSTSGNGVACNGSMWVAVGSGTNTIAYSYNGITWVGLGASIFSTQGNSVEWNGRIWVAVGEGTNTIATSTDGITWTGRGNTLVINGSNRQGTFFTTSGNGIVWTGSTWVAFGKGTTNNVVTSTDGITWNYLYTDLDDFDTVYYSQGTSDYSALGATPDARKGHWTASGRNEPRVYRFATPFGYNDGVNTSYGGNAIAWNGKLLVAVGQGATHTIATSPDGVNWTGLGNTIFSTAGYSVVWNGSMFIATGTGTNTVAISSNGTTWKGLGTTNFSDSANPIKLSVLNNGFTLNSYGIAGTQNLEINPGAYINNTNNININIQGLSLRKT